MISVVAQSGARKLRLSGWAMVRENVEYVGDGAGGVSTSIIRPHRGKRSALVDLFNSLNSVHSIPTGERMV